jgi:hypothetical protein
MSRLRKHQRIWIRSIARALIGGAAGGVVNALANMGIKPDVFNLGAGIGDTMKSLAAGAALSALLSIAMYLQKSPLPEVVETSHAIEKRDAA